MNDSFRIPSMPAKDADAYKAGRLSKTSEGVEFKYLETYLDDSSLPPVATAELEGELKAGSLPFDQNRIAQTVSALRYRRNLLNS